MKILIKKKEPVEYLLFKLTAEEIIIEVLNHVNRGRYLRAIKVVRSKGLILSNVQEVDLPLVEANLIITEKQAHFDLLVD